jgi:hypothetical protein
VVVLFLYPTGEHNFIFDLEESKKKLKDNQN